jgi:D-alanyl-D-alanine carboxypeptidase/D-alanyl-D-alanine-endopeptidase (penicillin-binding protein 4)
MIFSFYSNKAKPRIRVGSFLFLLLAFVSAFYRPTPCTAEVKAVLLTDPNGIEIYSINKTTPMVPASTLKLLTSLAALKTLGTSYRFHTLFAHDPETHDLFIKGFGDPLFISEQIKRLGNKIIFSFHPDQIHDIIIDPSFFSPDITIPGTGRSNNPYDATTGALCANFNTVWFKWSQRKKRFASAEPQTPFLDLLKPDIKKSGLKQGRILLSEPLRKIYPGLLLAHFLKERQVPITGNVINGPFCSSSIPVMTFESEFTLDQVVKKLLAFSNNFMANQLMLALGAHAFGPPATVEKGVKALRAFAKNTLFLDKIALAEGSGLSRRNRMTPSQMLAILMAFDPYHGLLRHKKNEFYKTGTLSDVRTRAGYLVGEDKKRYPYVIMLNNTHRGVERILRKLKKKIDLISSGKG